METKPQFAVSYTAPGQSANNAPTNRPGDLDCLVKTDMLSRLNSKLSEDRPP